MALSPNISTREFDKFEEVTENLALKTAVRVKVANSGEFSFSPSGLNIGGKVSEIAINDTTWTALPTTPLASRNAINIQNRSGFEIKINYDQTTVGYVGIAIDDQNERSYDITENIIIYAKAKAGSGSVTVTVEEIA